MKTDIPAFFSISELADVLGCSRRIIERRVESGVIKTIQHSPNGKRYIPLKDFKNEHPALWAGAMERLRIMGYEAEDYSKDE